MRSKKNSLSRESMNCCDVSVVIIVVRFCCEKTCNTWTIRNHLVLCDSRNVDSRIYIKNDLHLKQKALPSSILMSGQGCI